MDDIVACDGVVGNDDISDIDDAAGDDNVDDIDVVVDVVVILVGVSAAEFSVGEHVEMSNNISRHGAMRMAYI